MSLADPVQVHEKHLLGARALGDLSGFPALRKLSFQGLEVMLCASMLGAVRHASLTSISFDRTEAPECAVMVLQLSQALRRLGRGSVLRFADSTYEQHGLAEQALPPFYRCTAAQNACGR